MAVGRNCEGRAPPPSKETGVSYMNQLQGKIAVITGGTSCIGLAAAEVFLREGRCRENESGRNQRLLRGELRRAAR